MSFLASSFWPEAKSFTIFLVASLTALPRAKLSTRCFFVCLSAFFADSFIGILVLKLHSGNSGVFVNWCRYGSGPNDPKFHPNDPNKFKPANLASVGNIADYLPFGKFLSLFICSCSRIASSN